MIYYKRYNILYGILAVCCFIVVLVFWFAEFATVGKVLFSIPILIWGCLAWDAMILYRMKKKYTVRLVLINSGDTKSITNKSNFAKNYNLFHHLHLNLYFVDIDNITDLKVGISIEMDNFLQDIDFTKRRTYGQYDKRKDKSESYFNPTNDEIAMGVNSIYNWDTIHRSNNESGTLFYISIKPMHKTVDIVRPRDETMEYREGWKIIDGHYFLPVLIHKTWWRKKCRMEIRIISSNRDYGQKNFSLPYEDCPTLLSDEGSYEYIF